MFKVYIYFKELHMVKANDSKGEVKKLQKELAAFKKKLKMAEQQIKSGQKDQKSSQKITSKKIEDSYEAGYVTGLADMKKRGAALKKALHATELNFEKDYKKKGGKSKVAKPKTAKAKPAKAVAKSKDKAKTKATSTKATKTAKASSSKASSLNMTGMKKRGRPPKGSIKSEKSRANESYNQNDNDISSLFSQD